MWAISAQIAGSPIQGVFDTWDGGEVASNGASTYNAGGMADADVLLGTAQTGEVTVGRGYRGERDAPLEKYLAQNINAPVVFGRQALNPDKSPVTGGLMVFRGYVTGYEGPKVDSNGNNVTTLSIKAMIIGLPT